MPAIWRRTGMLLLVAALSGTLYLVSQRHGRASSVRTYDKVPDQDAVTPPDPSTPVTASAANEPAKRALTAEAYAVLLLRWMSLSEDLSVAPSIREMLVGTYERQQHADEFLKAWQVSLAAGPEKATAMIRLLADIPDLNLLHDALSVFVGRDDSVLWAVHPEPPGSIGEVGATVTVIEAIGRMLAVRSDGVAFQLAIDVCKANPTHYSRLVLLEIALYHDAGDLESLIEGIYHDPQAEMYHRVMAHLYMSGKAGQLDPVKCEDLLRSCTVDVAYERKVTKSSFSWLSPPQVAALLRLRASHHRLGVTAVLAALTEFGSTRSGRASLPHIFTACAAELERCDSHMELRWLATVLFGARNSATPEALLHLKAYLSKPVLDGGEPTIYVYRANLMAVTAKSMHPEDLLEWAERAAQYRDLGVLDTCLHALAQRGAESGYITAGPPRQRAMSLVAQVLSWEPAENLAYTLENVARLVRNAGLSEAIPQVKDYGRTHANLPFLKEFVGQCQALER